MILTKKKKKYRWNKLKMMKESLFDYSKAKNILKFWTKKRWKNGNLHKITIEKDTETLKKDIFWGNKVWA